MRPGREKEKHSKKQNEDPAKPEKHEKRKKEKPTHEKPDKHIRRIFFSCLF